MLKSEALNKEQELMNALQNTISSMEFEVERSGKEQNEIGDLLTFDFNAGINNEPALANLYFVPIHEDEVAENVFIESVAIIDEIEDPEKKAEMLQAVSVLNFNVIYGSFQLDPDINILTYRYVIPVHETMSREDALALLLRQFTVGLGIVNLYIAPLNALLEGRITWDEYILTLAELLKEGEEE